MGKERGTDLCELAVAGGMVKSKQQDNAEAALRSRREDKPLYKISDTVAHRPRISVAVSRNLKKMYQFANKECFRNFLSLRCDDLNECKFVFSEIIN